MRVVVVGATRNFFKVGHATFRVLARDRPDVRLRLAIPDIVDARRAITGIPVELFAWDPSRPTSLYPALGECTAMLMVPPIDGRVAASRIYLDAAQRARVEYILCLGIQHSGKTAMMGLDTEEVGEMLIKSNIRHDVLRLPVFLENLLYQVKSITDRREFQYPVGPDARFSYVTCGDLGEVFARILTDDARKSLHNVYWTADEPVSCGQLAHFLSRAVGATVNFRQCASADFVSTLRRKGMSEHAARAVLQLWNLIDAGAEPMPTDSLRASLGRAPTTAAQWAVDHSCCFTPDLWEKCSHPKPPRDHMY